VTISPRSEPLLWIQLLGAGVLPWELLLLLLLLAGSDPGPVPGLERLLCWGLGGLASTLLLWHRPADVWSLLLLQTPLRARRPLQQKLSRLQQDLPPRLLAALGGLAGLPLFWWLDDHAAMATPFSPLADSPRLVALLLASLLLALMVWQWQQLVQALWLLSRPPAAVEAASPMDQRDLEQQRLCLGLPLLLLTPLGLDTISTAGSRASAPEGSTAADAAPDDQGTMAPEATPATLDGRLEAVQSSDPAGRRHLHEAAGEPGADRETGAENRVESLTNTAANAAPPAERIAPAADGSADAAVAAAVDPEQTAEQQQGDDLDQQIL